MMIQVLDHGYVNQIETWGSDERIVEAARMSTGKGFLGWGPVHTDTCAHRISRERGDNRELPCNCTPAPGDEKLLKFLWDHKHATPFEMAGVTIEVMAPIFVFREWHRHRTASYNEMSARYTPLPDVNYIPSVERLMINAGATNKQAGTIKGASEMTKEAAVHFQSELRDVYHRQQALYEWALGAGVPKELARIHLPVGRYSRMRASANLRNWLAFLTLRMDSAAQYEIRMYANAVAEIIKAAFPITYSLFAATATA